MVLTGCASSVLVAAGARGARCTGRSAESLSLPQSPEAQADARGFAAACRRAEARLAEIDEEEGG